MYQSVHVKPWRNVPGPQYCVGAGVIEGAGVGWGVEGGAGVGHKVPMEFAEVLISMLPPLTVLKRVRLCGISPQSWLLLRF